MGSLTAGVPCFNISANTYLEQHGSLNRIHDINVTTMHVPVAVESLVSFDLRHVRMILLNFGTSVAA